MKAALIEDRPEIIQKLKKDTDLFNKTGAVWVRLHTFTNPADYLTASHAEQFDLAFVHLSLIQPGPAQTAFCGSVPVMIFLSEDEQDILRAVRTHHCFDFVPDSELSSRRISEILSEASLKLGFQERFLTVPGNHGDMKLPVQRIEYICSQNKKIRICVDVKNEHKSFIFRTTFRSITSQLDTCPSFSLCNRGICLNFAYVSEVRSDSFVMKDGTVLTVRKNGGSRVIRSYQDYLTKNLR